MLFLTEDNGFRGDERSITLDTIQVSQSPLVVSNTPFFTSAGYLGPCLHRPYLVRCAGSYCGHEWGAAVSRSLRQFEALASK